jgi:hypothetical protein
MAGQTTNYLFDYPTSTDYVKDGATAIETLADDVDSTLFTALGGTYPGLRLIKKQTIGPAVSSVTVTDAFSATYENYKIIVNGGAGSAGANMSFTLTGSTASYAYSLIYLPYGGSLSALSAASTSSFPYVGTASTNTIDMNCEVASPFLAKHTTIKAVETGSGSAGLFSGVHKVATSYTGFTFTPNTGTLTGGTVYVYGYGAS